MQLDKLALDADALAAMSGATHADAPVVAPSHDGCLSNSSGESCFRSSARTSSALSEDINATTLVAPVLPISRIRSASRKYLAICLRVIRRAEFIFVTLLEATGNSG